MKCSKEGMDLVQSKNWCLSHGYVTTRKSKSFHTQLPGLILTKDGDSIDHINRDCLDNRRNNLRIVNMRIQLINRNKQKNNTIGTNGIMQRQDRNLQYWVSRYIDFLGNQCDKYLSVKIHGYEEAKQLAIEHREREIRKDPDYREALGFSDED